MLSDQQEGIAPAAKRDNLSLAFFVLIRVLYSPSPRLFRSLSVQ